MELQALCVVHLEKRHCTSAEAQGALPPELSAEAFHLDSCQRRLWVFTQPVDLPASASRYQVLKGEEAYGFLLRVATGLESAVAGETDIFGQLKEAWQGFLARGTRSGCELSPWIQSVFEDAKEIRAAHLQNLGGASYGSLVRMLLRPTPENRILLVGAGQLAHAVAPFLGQSELWLWNRSPEKLAPLCAELERAGSKPARLVTFEHDELEAWQRADHVVVCVPPDAFRDPARIEARAGASGLTLHLGCLKGHAEATWERLSGFRSLSDLFDLRESQSNVRTTRIESASRACRERARLRSLGRSLSITHGWEDLAAF